MKKLPKFYVKSLLAGALLAATTAAATPVASQSPAKTWVDFSLRGKSGDCLLFAPTVDSTAAGTVKLFEKPKTNADVVATPAAGSDCRVLGSKQQGSVVWQQVQLSDKTTGWATFDSVVTPKNIHPFGGGKNVLLVFRPSCETGTTCQHSAWLITKNGQRAVEIGDGQFAFDAKGDNLFYDELSIREMGKKPVWAGFIYRYTIAENKVQKIIEGIAPSVHPQTNMLYFRNFKGQVMVSDFTGRTVRILYTPPEVTRLYVDAKGIAVPVKGDELDFPWGGYQTGPVKLFVQPEANVLPAPVQFLSQKKIRFQTPYAEGKLKATVSLDVES